jgi:uncharacterized damage-inducible protein DinB
MKYSVADGFPYYFDLVRDFQYNELFLSQATFTFLESISEEKACYRYSKDKWSIKQIVGHITDHERIKMYRAFLLSRNDAIQLWGYDQDILVKYSRFEELSFQDLIADFKSVRNASISFISTLSQKQLSFTGMANQHPITLEEFLKSIIGHEIHHLNIIREKYL